MYLINAAVCGLSLGDKWGCSNPMTCTSDHSDTAYLLGDWCVMALPHDECVSITRVCSRFCRAFSLMWSTESSKNLNDSSDRWHNRLCCERTSPLKPCCPQMTCSSTSTFLKRPAYKHLSQQKQFSTPNLSSLSTAARRHLEHSAVMKKAILWDWGRHSCGKRGRLEAHLMVMPSS